MSSSQSAEPQASAGAELDESRLVWIWSTPRSGSSELLAGLGSSERLMTVRETRAPAHLAPVLGEPVDVDGASLPATLYNYRADHPGYFLASAFADVWRPAFRSLVLARLQAGLEGGGATSEAGSGPMLALDEASSSHAADLTMSLFPRSRMIVVIRDGREVVAEQLAAAAESGPVDRDELLERAARRWACRADVAAGAHAAHSDQLGRLVRFEDLRADPAATLGALRDWLGIPAGPEPIAAGSSPPAEATRRRPAWVPGGRPSLRRSERRRLGEILGDRLARLGY